MMGTDSPRLSSVADLRAWCVAAPPGTRVDVEWIAEFLATVAENEDEGTGPTPAPMEPPPWREKLWTVDGATRLGVVEVAEALDRPKSYVYARTGPSADDPIPHRKMDGALVFQAAELRAWIRECEEVVAAGPMEHDPTRELKAV